MSPPAPTATVRLPRVSFGPFRLLEAVPWPMLALDFLAYVFAFAALRPWTGLAILTYGLRTSYRRDLATASVNAPG